MMSTFIFEILCELKIKQLRLGNDPLTDLLVDFIRQIDDESDFLEDLFLYAQAIHDKVYYMI